MHYKQFLYISLILLLITSCSEKEEGCLDIKATNFDASADKDCCCTYPSLVLNFSHKFDTLSFRVDEEYTLNEVDTFTVSSITMLFSGIHPLKNGATSFVEDTIHIQLDDGIGNQLLEIEDNFILVKPTRFEYEVGTFSEPNTYDEIELDFGLKGDLNRIVPDSVHQSDHVLRSESDSIWNETEKYFYLYMNVTPDKDQPDLTKEVIISGENNQIELLLDGPLLADVGYDFDVNVQIDYKLLFSGIDFVADDSINIANMIQQNLANSISILE